MENFNAQEKSTISTDKARRIFRVSRKLKILPDVLDRHTGFFHAADHPQPLDVAFAELADAAG